MLTHHFKILGENTIFLTTLTRKDKKVLLLRIIPITIHPLITVWTQRDVTVEIYQRSVTDLLARQ